MPRRPQVKDVDDYIAKAPAAAQPILNELRMRVHQTTPHAEEKILYGMPFFLIANEKIGIAAYKAHVSFQISKDLTPAVLETAKKLGYASGQKRININFDQKVPVELVGAILAIVINQ